MTMGGRQALLASRSALEFVYGRGKPRALTNPVSSKRNNFPPSGYHPMILSDSATNETTLRAYFIKRKMGNMLRILGKESTGCHK